jgi:hypothetical protein
MSWQSQLPLWVQYVQALGAPLLAVVVACVGAGLAWQQVRIARIRLQHDLYDRRFAVFQAARSFLAEVMTHGYPSDDQIRVYVVGTADAIFLLNEDIATYLAEIRRKSIYLQEYHETLKSLPVGDERTAIVKQNSVIFAWLMEQLPAGLVKKFKPFLTLETRRKKRELLPLKIAFWKTP